MEHSFRLQLGRNVFRGPAFDHAAADHAFSVLIDSSMSALAVMRRLTYEAALELARAGAELTLISRSEEKARGCAANQTAATP